MAATGGAWSAQEFLRASHVKPELIEGYAALFEENSIDQFSIGLFSKDDLLGLGLRIGDALKVVAAAAKLGQLAEQGSAAPSAGASKESSAVSATKPASHLASGTPAPQQEMAPRKSIKFCLVASCGLPEEHNGYCRKHFVFSAVTSTADSASGSAGFNPYAVHAQGTSSGSTHSSRELKHLNEPQLNRAPMGFRGLFQKPPKAATRDDSSDVAPSLSRAMTMPANHVSTPLFPLPADSSPDSSSDADESKDGSHRPLRGMARWRHIIRQKVLPYLSTRWNRLFRQLPMARSFDMDFFHDGLINPGAFGLRVSAHVQQLLRRQDDAEQQELMVNSFVDQIVAMFKTIKQFRTVLSISNSLANAPMQKESVLHSMVIAVYDVLECERVSVFLINEDDPNLLDLAITSDAGFRSEFPKIAFELHSQGVASFVARSGEVLNIADAYAEPRFNPSFDQRTGFRTRTILCVPMVNAAGQTLGVIQAVNKTAGRRLDSSASPVHHPSAAAASVAGSGAATVDAAAAAVDPAAAEEYPVFSNEDAVLLQFIGVVAAGIYNNCVLLEDAKRQQANQQALLSIIDSLTAETRLTEIARRVVQAAYSFVKADRVSFFLVEDSPVPGHGANKDLVCIVSKDASMKNLRIPFGMGVMGRAAETGELILVNDTRTSEHFSPTLDRISGYHTRNLLTLPIKDCHGEVAAVIQCVNKAGGSQSFTPSDERIMVSLARSTGEIIRKAQAFQELREQRLISEVLLKLMRDTSDAQDIDTLIQDVFAAAYSLLHCQRVAMFMVDDMRRELYCVASPDAKNFTIPWNRGVVGFVAQNKNGVNIPDAYSDPRFDSSFDKRTGILTQSILCVPVLDRSGGLLAVLQAVNKHAFGRYSETPLAEDDKHLSRASFASFTRQDEKVFAALAAQVGHLLSRHLTDALLERTQIAPETSLHSMLEIYGAFRPRVVRSRAHLAPHRGNNSAAGGARALQSAVDAAVVASASGSASVGGGLLDLGLAAELDPVVGGAVRRGWYVWPEADSKLLSNRIRMLERLRTVEFNCWDHTPEQLLEYALLMFQDTGLMERFRVNQDVFQQFLVAVLKGYRNNPYHNWYHGFSTLQYCYALLYSCSSLSDILSELERFSMLIAALCHDVDHPGTTNDFEINRDSRLALRYNDISVLENHHAFTTFEMLSQPQLGVFTDPNSAFDPQMRRAARRTIISAVMATDMSHHQEMCQKLDQLQPMCQSLHKDSEKDRMFLVNLIVHSADLGGQTYVTEVAKLWEERISQEFHNQAQTMGNLGMPVPAFFLGLDSLAIRAKNQIGFIEYVLRPLFKGLTAQLPPAQAMYNNLLANREYFENLHRELTAAAAPPESAPKSEAGAAAAAASATASEK